MENKEVQVEEGIRLSDIFRLLLSKLKYLILAALLGGILGGAFAVWRTIKIDYWGTTVEFYVNPEKPKESVSGDGSQYGVYGAYGRHVMDNMVRLLSSESFTEKLILKGEELPEKGKWVNPANQEEVQLGLDGLIDNAVAADLDGKQTTLNDAIRRRNETSDALSKIEDTIDSIWLTMYANQDVNTKTFDEYTYENLMNKPQNLVDAVTAKKNTELALEVEIKKVTEANAAKIEAEATIEKALEAWRQTSAYKSKLASYKSAVSFSYLKAGEDYEDANNLARSFIYVRISALGDAGKNLANELLEIIKVVVPEYVEENMTVPNDYEGTNCQRITRTDDIRLTNPRYTTNQAIKYAVLVALAAVVVVAVILIILDKSDKRLRDTEIITKEFNVPLLGIVPSIEELKTEQSSKKANNSHSTEVK